MNILHLERNIPVLNNELLQLIENKRKELNEIVMAYGLNSDTTLNTVKNLIIY